MLLPPPLFCGEGKNFAEERVVFYENEACMEGPRFLTLQ